MFHFSCVGDGVGFALVLPISSVFINHLKNNTSWFGALIYGLTLPWFLPWFALWHAFHVRNTNRKRWVDSWHNVEWQPSAFPQFFFLTTWEKASDFWFIDFVFLCVCGRGRASEEKRKIKPFIMQLVILCKKMFSWFLFYVTKHLLYIIIQRCSLPNLDPLSHHPCPINATCRVTNTAGWWRPMWLSPVTYSADFHWVDTYASLRRVPENEDVQLSVSTTLKVFITRCPR